MTDTPIACDLNAIPPEQREQHGALAERIFGAVAERKELSDGYAFRLSMSLWTTVQHPMAKNRRKRRKRMVKYSPISFLDDWRRRRKGLPSLIFPSTLAADKKVQRSKCSVQRKSQGLVAVAAEKKVPGSEFKVPSKKGPGKA